MDPPVCGWTLLNLLTENFTFLESYCEVVPEATCSTQIYEIDSQMFIFEIILICSPGETIRLANASPPVHTRSSRVALVHLEVAITAAVIRVSCFSPAGNCHAYLTWRQVWPEERAQDALIIVPVL